MRQPSDRDVEWADVQALVLNGFRSFGHSVHGIMRIEDPDLLRGWIGKNLDDIVDVFEAGARNKLVASLFGEEAQRPDETDLPQNTLTIAFTADGLKALGFCKETLDRFPFAFTEGMAPTGEDTRRAGILGDYAENDSLNWHWGGRARADDDGPGDDRPGRQPEVHVLLGVFGWYRDRVEGAFDEAVKDSGLTLAVPPDAEGASPARISTRLDPQEDAQQREQDEQLARIKVTEHFGYRDAISQPMLQGTKRERKASAIEREFHSVPIGDFVLGHNSSRGRPAPDISLPPSADPAGILCRTVDGKPDFGRNGTFLVVRQLEQDVEAFNCLVRKVSDHLDEEPVPPQDGPDFLADWRAWMRALGSEEARRMERAAALLMGRWRNGTPMVAETGLRDPAHPGSAPTQGNPKPLANNFGYHHLDRAGLICPIGSHVRRVNPRDCLPPGPKKSLELTLGHRILRRSRLYGPEVDNTNFSGTNDEKAPRGLLFICLNTDINRQFEFIQHTWINNPNFGKRIGEIDPIVGTVAPNRKHALIPGRPKSERIKLGPQPVRVRGGAYFFLPSRRALKFLAQG